MKDLELKDILIKKTKPYTRVSVYRDGRWMFIYPQKLVKVTDSQRFYRIDEKFGLVKAGNNDPKAASSRGVPGDYVSVGIQQAVMATVTVEEYNILFPPANRNPPNRPITSAFLQDPTFVTKLLKGSPTTNSNTTNTITPTPSTRY
tara:strand:+ start:400 stop:837 length:438 start_codon:yes stop_codon:yes gene_type:complete